MKNESNVNPSLSASEDSTSDVISVSGRYIAAVIAKNLDIEMKDFNHYNPGFDNMLATGASYELRLPDDKIGLFIANKYIILNECLEQLLGDINQDTKTVYKNRNTPVKGKTKK